MPPPAWGVAHRAANVATTCAAPGCSKSPAVRLKTVPLCDVHAQFVMSNASERDVSVIALVTQDVWAMLDRQAETAVSVPVAA